MKYIIWMALYMYFCEKLSQELPKSTTNGGERRQGCQLDEHLVCFVRKKERNLKLTEGKKGVVRISAEKGNTD